MASNDLATVRAMTTTLESLLERAQTIKNSSDIDPPLPVIDLGEEVDHVAYTSGVSGGEAGGKDNKSQSQYAVIETAVRNIFYELLAQVSIDTPAFVRVWNLLDLVSYFSDTEQCDPALIFWIIEELLDSQTIDGCRKVFDYLESRREQIVAKHFKQKNLIILRSCNELLRRLSRAEDTVFCGRVFIFLFQSFPLGDKSSVNLRGEYHIENVTTYDEIAPKTEEQVEISAEVMEVDSKSAEQDNGDDEKSREVKESGTIEATATEDLQKTVKTVSFDPKEPGMNDAMDINTFYPIFWSLQHDFSNPTRLFQEGNFTTFKQGLDGTLDRFRTIQKESDARGTGKLIEESRRGLKRKRGDVDGDMKPTFNPKYLTSRDLFELEISDLAFRRHILVQALILVDFLLSLTPKAKAKFSALNNKSVLYNFTLSDEDAAWATNIRGVIAHYLQQLPDGKFYYRMVDTVLSRDKNWVRWKADSCPPIERPQISPQEFAEARTSAQKLTANKRLRATPLGSLDLSFLCDGEHSNGLERLKENDRYSMPAPEQLRSLIVGDEFDLDMAKEGEEKETITSLRASKIWRVLRITSRNKLKLFDNIDDGKNLDPLFQTDADSEVNQEVEKPDTPGVKGGIEELREGTISDPANGEV